MNIFMSDADARVSAQALDDRRLFKMTIESAQLLSNVIRLDDGLRHLHPHLYKPSHLTHPLQTWLLEPAHADWLYQHLIGLCHEYTYRTDRLHPTAERLEVFQEAFTTRIFVEPGTPFTSVPQSCRIVPKEIDFNPLGVVDGYQFFLAYKWACLDPHIFLDRTTRTRRMMPKWGRRLEPAWLPEVTRALPRVFRELHPEHTFIDNEWPWRVELPARLLKKPRLAKAA